MVTAKRAKWWPASSKKRNSTRSSRKLLWPSFAIPAPSTALATSPSNTPSAPKPASTAPASPNTPAPSKPSPTSSSTANPNLWWHKHSCLCSSKSAWRHKLISLIVYFDFFLHWTPLTQPFSHDFRKNHANAGILPASVHAARSSLSDSVLPLISVHPMLPFKLIYHERYDLNLGAHVFPSEKFRLIHDKLLNDCIAATDNFLRPDPATDADIRRVHTEDWVQKLKTGTLTASEQMKLEVPYSPELVHAFWLAAGGTITAAESALQDGFACNIAGGFHHAYPGHSESFCAIHDVAVAIRTLQARKKITPAMAVDTD